MPVIDGKTSNLCWIVNGGDHTPVRSYLLCIALKLYENDSLAVL
jgi:hypothetical protein